MIGNSDYSALSKTHKARKSTRLCRGKGVLPSAETDPDQGWKVSPAFDYALPQGTLKSLRGKKAARLQMSKSSPSQGHRRALNPAGNLCANWELRKKSHPSVQEREEGKIRLQWAQGWVEHLGSPDAEKINGSHSRAHSPAETGSRTKG